MINYSTIVLLIKMKWKKYGRDVEGKKCSLRYTYPKKVRERYKVKACSKSQLDGMRHKIAAQVPPFPQT